MCDLLNALREFAVAVSRYLCCCAAAALLLVLPQVEVTQLYPSAAAGWQQEGGSS
jgi:hypothetical protein